MKGGQRQQGSGISVHRVLSFSDVVCKKTKTTRAFEVRGAMSFTKFVPGDGVGDETGEGSSSYASV